MTIQTVLILMITSMVNQKNYTSHDGEWVVPENEIFVSGDNRVGNNSYDSRSGLGTVPLYKIVGPVAFRILPLNKIRNFEYNQQY